MKSLVQYIKEASDESEALKKTISLNFSGLEKSEDTISELTSEGESSGIPVSVDGEKVTIEITSETIDKASKIEEILARYIQTCNDSGKRSSDESYAQKLSVFEKQVKAFSELKDEAKAKEEENSADAKKTEDETVNKDDKK